MAISTIGSDGLASSAVTNPKLASGVPSTAKLPAGTVLQVVSVNYTTQQITTSTSYSDTGLTATITPSSASSKILVITSQPCYMRGNSDYFTNGVTQLVANGSALILHIPAVVRAYTAGGTVAAGGFDSFIYLHSPNTTSSVVYKTQFKSDVSGSEFYVNSGGGTSTITLMEIAA